MIENNQKTKADTVDVVPVEKPETSITELLTEESPEVALARIEKVAELAPRFEQALRQILITCTFPQDWEIFGSEDKAKACLSSHGAMRIGKHFQYHIFDVTYKKEEWTDSIGKAYRYVYSCKAALGGRIISAIGIYSTRDEFLGKAQGTYKSIEEINEADIMAAAHSIMQGNAIKALLGLKNFPADEYNKLMERTGQDVKTTGQHTYAKGTKGGTDNADRPKQNELAQICIKIANEGYEAKREGNEVTLIAQDSDVANITDPIEVAKSICETISSFPDKKSGKIVKGLLASQLSGKRLDISLAKAKQLFEGISQG